jgi:D-beta-D-heptose 7-phosphate kinase / D-beta-D-heptose 1-phosphate adenosyltransferase
LDIFLSVKKTPSTNKTASAKSAIPILPATGGIHVVVVGDVMLDRYWHGPADRVSPEAPVPVINVQHTEQRPGGAANVALNIVSLGARCTLVGLIGDDEAGEELTTTLTAAGVQCDFVRVPDWPTVVKLRLLAQKQQLIRADFEEEVPAIGASERISVVQNKVEKHLQGADVLILEDYDKGAIEEPQGLIHAALQASVPVLVDPKMKPLSEYANATVIKPNEKEFAHALRFYNPGDDVKNSEQRAAAAKVLCQELQVDGLVVTRGGEGMEVCTQEDVRHIPARPVEVYDVTGAGDTTAAGLALGLALRWSLLDCARMANVAASLVVAKSGTSPVTGPELRYVLANEVPDRGRLSREELAMAVADAQANGERLVFTNGCFDILHAGHVTYLEEAAALGDRLVVAINDDASVTRLKGEGRPVIPEEGRSRVLQGLGCVDWVVSFAEDTPESLLELLKPDVLVKGGDYDTDGVVGGDIVKAYGGEVRVLSLVADISTTAIVERIRQNEKSSI